MRSRIAFQRVHTPTTPHLQQVKHGFDDLIRRSLRIQLKLDLAATGLESDWSTSFTLVDRVKALEEYRSRWQNVDIDRYQIETVRSQTVESKTVVGGVYGILTDDGVIRFCTLSSSSDR